ncbi:MAG: cytidylate kinase-like family protein [Oscillibacter sp.]|nr:cytidylate kinase-like family protein [Oscillibacter sp.]
MTKYVISISREFGSGGRLIGRKLATKLGIPCFDRTIIQKTAEKSGLSPEFIARAEERARSRFHWTIAPLGVGAPTFTTQSIPVSHQAFFAQAEVIRELADQGPCVIVGRCSDYVLDDRPECVKVFIHADMPSRIERSVNEYDVPAENASTYINQMDRGRANYYNYYTGHTWGDMRLYDLTINSTTTGIDGAVELIAAMLRHREELEKAAVQL